MQVPVKKGQWAELAVAERDIRCRVTPNSGGEEATYDGLTMHLRVTATPEAGKANRAAGKLLARALGIAPGRLSLVRGGKSRDKTFRIGPP